MTIPLINQELLDSSSLPNATSADNPDRLKLGSQSLWQRITHFSEKRQLDKKLNASVKELFAERYEFQNEEVFTRVWNRLGAKVWNPKSELTVGVLRDIDTKFRKEMIYHGDGIAPPTTKTASNKKIKDIVQVLLHGEKLSHRHIGKSVAKAVFVRHDPNFMKQFAQELQNELTSLAAKPPNTKQEEIIWRAFLGNVIALMPFTYPQNGDVFTIPILNSQRVCRPVAYTVEVLPLPLTDFSTPMHALGLTSKDDPEAPPILSYLGTTFPAVSGFATTILADFTPGHSVGEAVYKRNKVDKIEKWIKGKENIHAVGMSLGGAMVFHTLLDHHTKLGRVDVYNPPGLYPSAWKKEIGTSCDISIYRQPGDLVSELGAWPTGDNVSLYTIYGHHDDLSENILSSHARAFTGCNRITVIKEDPKKVNASFFRKFLTTLHQIAGPFLVFLPISFSLLMYNLASSINRISNICIRKINKIGSKFGS